MNGVGLKVKGPLVQMEIKFFLLIKFRLILSTAFDPSLSAERANLQEHIVAGLA